MLLSVIVVVGMPVLVVSVGVSVVRVVGRCCGFEVFTPDLSSRNTEEVFVVNQILISA